MKFKTSNGKRIKLCVSRHELDDILFRALRTIYQLEQTKVAHFGLKYEGLFLLQFLARNHSCRMGDIAREMKIPISTLTRIVERLEKRKFVARRKDEADKRSVFLYLEPDGEDIVSKIEHHTRQMLINNLHGYGKRDLNAFLKTANAADRLFSISSEDDMNEVN